MGNEYVDIQMGRTIAGLVTGGMARRAEESAIDSWEKAAKGWEARAIREQERKERAKNLSWQYFVSFEALDRSVKELLQKHGIDKSEIDGLITKYRSSVLDEYPDALEYVKP